MLLSKMVNFVFEVNLWHPMFLLVVYYYAERHGLVQEGILDFVGRFLFLYGLCLIIRVVCGGD